LSRLWRAISPPQSRQLLLTSAAGALNIAFLFVYKDRRSRLFVALLAVLSFAISIVEFTVLMPLFSSIHTSYYLIRYSYLGKRYQAIALNLLQHPALLVQSLFLFPLAFPLTHPTRLPGARNYNKCMSYVSQHYTFLYRNGGYFIAKKKT